MAGGWWEHTETRVTNVAQIDVLLRIESTYHSCEELEQQGSETPPITRLCGSGHPTDFCKRTAKSVQLFSVTVFHSHRAQELPPLGGRSHQRTVTAVCQQQPAVVSPGAQYMSSKALEQISD